MAIDYTAFVDWFQYTGHVGEMDFASAYVLDASSAVTECHRRMVGDDLHFALLDELLATRSGHEKRYKLAATFASGVTIFYGGHPHFTVQLSGKACKYLREQGGYDALKELIARTSDNCSRIDFAVDFHTEMSVDELATGTKPSATARSKQGDTNYYGSRKADKYARLYRYHAPNPRSKTLRFEVEYKRKAAKKMAGSLAGSPVDESFISGVIKRELRLKGMQHDMFSGEELRVKVSDGKSRASGATLAWLSTQVAAAIRRLVETGEATPDEVWEALNFDELFKAGNDHAE